MLYKIGELFSPVSDLSYMQNRTLLAEDIIKKTNAV